MNKLPTGDRADPAEVSGKKRMAKNEQKRVALFKKIDRERKKALGLKDWGMKGRRDKKPGKTPPDAFGYE